MLTVASFKNMSLIKKNDVIQNLKKRKEKLNLTVIFYRR